MTDLTTLAREAFWGSREALWGAMLATNSYAIDGVTYPANGLTLAEAIATVQRMDREEVELLASL